MIRTPLAVALLLAAGIAPPAFAADTPPTAPAHLSAKLYPGAGGELFWKRSADDRGVRGYEITINGRSVGTRDATSHYDASLKAGTPYAFTVTAIDTAGQRSAKATVSIGGASTTVMPASGAPAATGASRAPAAPAAAPTSTAGAPAAPAGLRATVYDARSAELFWTRAATPGLRYEVRRDGAAAATTNGTSHYASGLAAGRAYAYQVIAIDGSGRRSAPASVSVRTGGGAGTAASTGPAAPVANPTAAPATGSAPTATPAAPAPAGNTLAAIQPRNVSIKVYSATAAELFWTPAGDFRPVVSKNEIRRDGVLIATVQGEYLRSYFDGKREPGKRYTYEITAISSAGRASARVSDAGASAPQPVSRPATTTPVAGLPGNVRAKLDTTFEIINGVAFEKVVATIGRLSDRTTSASLGIRPTGRRVENRNQVVSDVFACPKGGELLRATGGDNARFPTELQGNDCAIGPIVFDGYVQTNPQVGGGADFRPISLNAIGVELDDARDLSTVTLRQGFYFADPNDPRFSSWSADVSVARPQHAYRVGVLSGVGNDRINLLPDGTSGLTVTGRGILGEGPSGDRGPFDGTAVLNTLGPLEFGDGRDDARPSGGRISIGSATDSLLIDAGNGDPATFTLTATSGGTTTSYTVPFSAAYRFEAPIPTGVDLGF